MRIGKYHYQTSKVARNTNDYSTAFRYNSPSKVLYSGRLNEFRVPYIQLPPIVASCAGALH
jgi:hypothetical protein